MCIGLCGTNWKMRWHRSSPSCTLPAAVCLFLPGKNVEQGNDTIWAFCPALIIHNISLSDRDRVENWRVFVVLKFLFHAHQHIKTLVIIMS